MAMMECHYCGISLNNKTATRDHIVPRARGGLDLRWNRIWACARCNVKKADDWPDCQCNICRRSKRRHWEILHIRADQVDKRGKLK